MNALGELCVLGCSYAETQRAVLASIPVSWLTVISGTSWRRMRKPVVRRKSWLPQSPTSDSRRRLGMSHVGVWVAFCRIACDEPVRSHQSKVHFWLHSKTVHEVELTQDLPIALRRATQPSVLAPVQI
ncbi:MAG: hypothetical protein QXT73_07440 [Candidatus Methanomethylicaceae archaeon]